MFQALIAIVVAVLLYVVIERGFSNHLDPIPPAQVAALSACEKDYVTNYTSHVTTQAITASDVSAAKEFCADQPNRDAEKALIAQQQRALHEQSRK